MAQLTAQRLGPQGVDLTFPPADVAGDTFLPSTDQAKLLVRNDDATTTDVTIPTPGTVSGLGVDDRVVTVPAGGMTAIPLLKRLYADPTTGQISIGYEKVTSLTVAVIE